MVEVTFFDPSIDDDIERNCLRTFRIRSAIDRHAVQIVRLDFVLLGPIADDENLCRA